MSRRFFQSKTPGPGDRLASFTLLPYRGTQSVSWEPGRVTVLSFCALWCDTWREQSARLRAVRRSLDGLPITYRTISVDGRWAERFTDGGATDTDVLLDSGGRLSERLGVRAVPWTFVADKAGVIRFARQGIVRQEELEPLLRRLITGAGPSVDDAAVFLTFDDFPTVKPGASISEDEDLLDILRAASVPATFFCIGEHLTESAGASAARRAAREGHSLQMHSWEHDAANPNLPRCIRTLCDLTGSAPTLYRPPGHSELYSADGRTPVTPRRPVVNPYDFQRPGPAELTRRILHAAGPGSVIQLHAGIAETRNILPGLLEAIRRRNLSFATLT
jgi:peptidoglycan/xylan/chitin deacetylase (PgdA/CDA1 family)